MGYRILYDSGTSVKTPITEGKSRLPVLVAAFLLLFGLLTRLFWPAGTDKLRQIIIPGDPDVTEKAVIQMVDDLRAGVSMGDAVETFCQEIFCEAGYSD